MKIPMAVTPAEMKRLVKAVKALSALAQRAEEHASLNATVTKKKEKSK